VETRELTKSFTTGSGRRQSSDAPQSPTPIKPAASIGNSIFFTEGLYPSV
jgi:hypothetical protein